MEIKHCKKCVMPNTRPGIYFNEEGICSACLNAEKKKNIDWEKRRDELKKLCDKYRREDGYYDCVITVSGGKDSYFQVYVMKEIMNMNPLLISVQDSFTHTNAGAHNIKNLTEAFGCDIITYKLNEDTNRKMIRIALEEFGSPNWAIDLAIYSVPLKLAESLKIPLIVYGENISYEYGGPNAKETYSAKEQIKNNVVREIDWNLWAKKDVSKKEVEMIKYPSPELVDTLEPIYLSYFYLWSGYKNYQLAKKYGFIDLSNEWKRDGTIEDFDQIDSKGYLVHRFFKYPKFGHCKVTDVASFWIREGRLTREEAVKLVNEKDHKLDQLALKDFLDFTGYTNKEFWDIVDKFWNQDIFKKVNGEWKMRDEAKLK